MHQTSQTTPLTLNGIDGGNPLGFLAALGAAIVTSSFCQETRFCWCLEGGSWRPVLHGCTTDKARFIGQLHDALKAESLSPFQIDNKLPFSVVLFETTLREAQRSATPTDRRMTDFLAAFGSEISPEKGAFQASRFRMVRSGDSAGQGLPAYARAIRGAANRPALERTLFMPWDYRDRGFSLRWDPIEDQRYALRWHDPSKSSPSDGPGTMFGANSLAIEALQWYPTMFQGNRLSTTGFHRNSKNEVWFTWPIWNTPVSLDAVRSLLALSDLQVAQPPRAHLVKRGIVEAYRCQRIQQNQYYSNFASGRPA
jgi:hypothetical protein